jgi:acyl-CoA synthetase (AMP-forming)/AMP-acid ligase II
MFMERQRQQWFLITLIIYRHAPLRTSLLNETKFISADHYRTFQFTSSTRTSISFLVAKRLAARINLKGELLIGGIGLANGYLGNDELTSERFIPNHFLNTGTRMYRTGDLCKWSDSGELIFLGRQDGQNDMEKAKGYLAELDEDSAGVSKSQRKIQSISSSSQPLHPLSIKNVLNTESKVRNIWSSVLNVDKAIIYPDTSYFEVD